VLEHTSLLISSLLATSIELGNAVMFKEFDVHIGGRIEHPRVA